MPDPQIKDSATMGPQQPMLVEGPIGKPPTDSLSNSVVMNSMPICIIEPCTMEFGISSIKTQMKPAWTEGGKDSYLSQLKDLGYEYKPYSGGVKAIELMYVPDSMIVESLQNTYGDTFLNRMTDAVGEGFGDFGQMTGSRNFSGGLDTLMKNLQGSNNGVMNAIGTGMDSARRLLKEGGAAAENATNSAAGSKNGLVAGAGRLGQGAGKIISSAAGMADKLLGGQRLDFPSVWKNSSYQPTYSITIKLYNPNPGSVESTQKYIAGPLAAIMLLATPMGMGDTYSWPFFCKVRSPGMFKIPAAAIQNITITKGGEYISQAYSKMLGYVEVRIDFISLFSTLVTSSGSTQWKNTLKEYLENLVDKQPVLTMGYENIDEMSAEGVINPWEQYESNPRSPKNLTSTVNSTMMASTRRVSDSKKSLYEEMKGK
jgi:hypothetical protein